MTPVVHPPDVILRAYADLIDQAFLFIRANAHYASKAEGIQELADAMHNIGAIVSSYGAWTDDEKYRDVYLRPFDKRWGNELFRLEAFLDERIKEYSR
jgi:hypothetical protein